MRCLLRRRRPAPPDTFPQWPGPYRRTAIPGREIPTQLSCSTNGFREAEFVEFRFDILIHVVLAEFVRDPDGILDGIRLGAAMADNRDSLHAKQRRAAVFGIIQPAPELLKSLLSEDVADLRGKRLFQF